jgi:undecaprenol kinase
VKETNLIKRFLFAYNGLRVAFKTELSFKLECLAGVFIFSVLVYLRPPAVWWALITIISGAVLAAELINTGLERALDKLHPARDPLIGQAKDCAAAAVLVLSLSAIGVFAALVCQYF